MNSLTRLDTDVESYLIANKNVHIEQKALTQVHEIAGLAHELNIQKIIATPDLHVGSPFPVGVVIETHGIVIPGSTGNDIGCGMKLVSFDVNVEEIDQELLMENLRRIFFQGQREVVTSPRQRRSILSEGLLGFVETFEDNAQHGIWTDIYNLEKDLHRIYKSGSLIAESIFPPLERWIQSSGEVHGREDQLGSLGGGNHFTELQSVHSLKDPAAAHAYGLKEDQLVAMIHTGSTTLGSAVGTYYRDLAKKNWTGKNLPDHLYPLTDNADICAYLDHLANAANFATINRVTLALMFRRALQQTVGRDIQMQSIWDAPHNLVWQEGDHFTHRKGATPAEGANTSFDYYGDPVLLPGSMGDSSWVMQGLGNRQLLQSASHGAGRKIARGQASKIEDGSVDKLKVVLPVNIQELIARGRSDIARDIEKQLREEAPGAYKPVLPALESLAESEVAKPVAELRPIMTIKQI